MNWWSAMSQLVGVVMWGGVLDGTPKIEQDQLEW